MLSACWAWCRFLTLTPRWVGCILAALLVLFATPRSLSAATAPVPKPGQCSPGGNCIPKDDPRFDRFGIGRECLVDKDCAATACQGNVCMLGGAGVRCQNALDCNVRRCSAGKCLKNDQLADGAQCTQDSDCEEPRCSLTGKCEKGGLLFPCSPEQSCPKKVCVRDLYPGATQTTKCVPIRDISYHPSGMPGWIWKTDGCNTDTDCGPEEPHKCTEAGKCVPAAQLKGTSQRPCSSDRDCPAVKTCMLNKCSPVGLLTGSRICTADADCKAEGCYYLNHRWPPHCALYDIVTHSCGDNSSCGHRECCLDERKSSVCGFIPGKGDDSCTESSDCAGKEGLVACPRFLPYRDPGKAESPLPDPEPEPALLSLAPPPAGSFFHVQLGARNSAPTLSAFIDTHCGSCRAAFMANLKPIIERFVAAGQLRVEIFEFPLTADLDSPSAKFARGDLCAFELGGEAGYLAFISQVFATPGAELESGDVSRVAARSGAPFDLDAFGECLTRGDILDALGSAERYGVSTGIVGTPTFFFERHEFPGRPTVSDIERLLGSNESGEPTATLRALSPGVVP